MLLIVVHVLADTKIPLCLRVQLVLDLKVCRYVLFCTGSLFFSLCDA